MNRRRILEGGAIGITGAAVAARLWPRAGLPRRQQESVVAILRCDDYATCHKAVEDGLRLLAPSVRGKRVLLKPNLVEYSTKATINTHPSVIAATADSLFRLGASEVVVADGPGHVRDSEMLIDESGLKRSLSEVGRIQFVDLNFDAVHRVTPRGGFTSFRELWLPRNRPRCRRGHLDAQDQDPPLGGRYTQPQEPFRLHPRATSTVGPRTFCIGKASTTPSQNSRRPFPSTTSSLMES